MTPREKAFALIVGVEGADKITNDPNDPGGITKWGISDLRDGLRDGMVDVDGDGIADHRIESLTREDALAIFTRDYWSRVHGDDLPEELAVFTADAAYLQGEGTARKLLQQALVACGARLTVDGSIGPATISAAHAIDTVESVARLCQYRTLAAEQAPKWPVYKGGWLYRMSKMSLLAFS